VVLKEKASLRLDAGAYRALKLGEKATLTLTGGVYTFASWEVAREASVVVEAPSEIRIVGEVALGEKARIAVKPGVAGLDARDVVLAVAGTGASKPPGAGGVKAPVFVADRESTVGAYVLAPNGEIRVGEKVFATGGFIGRSVSIGKETRIGLWTDTRPR
jgi:hypothetical protein